MLATTTMAQIDVNAHIELLRDALDHIVRVANSARMPTNRLDWITARARMALRGEEWSRDYLPLPRYQKDERTRDLQSALRKIVLAFDQGNVIELRDAIELARRNFPSLFRGPRDGG